MKTLMPLALAISIIALLSMACLGAGRERAGPGACGEEAAATRFPPKKVWIAIDGTGSYGEQTAQAVAFAADLVESIAAPGDFIALSWITGNSFPPETTIASLEVPSLAVPTPPDDPNPIKQRRLMKKYCVELNDHSERLEGIERQVGDFATQMRTLPPPAPIDGTDVWGALAKGEDALAAGRPGRSVIVLLSDGQHNVAVHTPRDLSGVEVFFAQLRAEDSVVAREVEDYWSSGLQTLGAATVRFFPSDAPEESVIEQIKTGGAP